MIETRLREHLNAQYRALPEPENRLHEVVGEAKRHLILRRAGLALVATAVVVMVVVGSGWLMGANRAVAASPFSGIELPVIHESPVILQGKLGPAPQVEPDGVDLTFEPIATPTANDLAAIEETSRHAAYTDPVVVALGRIAAFDTNVYAIHDVDPATGRGHSSVVAVGPGYPTYMSRSGPAGDERWGPSGNRAGSDGVGSTFMRIPTYATWQFAQLDVDGDISWQRSSDGFIWMPHEASLDSEVTLTAHDPVTGKVGLRYRSPARDIEP